MRIALTVNDELISDVCVIELDQEVIVLYKRICTVASDRQHVFKYICMRVHVVELFPNRHMA